MQELTVKRQSTPTCGGHRHCYYYCLQFRTRRRATELAGRIKKAPRNWVLTTTSPASTSIPGYGKDKTKFDKLATSAQYLRMLESREDIPFVQNTVSPNTIQMNDISRLFDSFRFAMRRVATNKPDVLPTRFVFNEKHRPVATSLHASRRPTNNATLFTIASEVRYG